QPERQPEVHQHGPADPSADEQELALGEVHHLGGLVDQHERHGDHAVEHADDDAVDDQLQQQLPVHRAPSALAAATVLAGASERATACSGARSTTRSSVWIRDLVPSWKVMVASTFTSSWSL